jgi:hypothetical protein
MSTALKLLIAFVALYPVVSAALWIAGGLMFRLLDEHPTDRPAGRRRRWGDDADPAFEEPVIAIGVGRLASDYPRLESWCSTTARPTTRRQRRSGRRRSWCRAAPIPAAARPSSSTPASHKPRPNWW